MNEDVNRMLRDLLKTELRKLGKTDTRGSVLPGPKERKNSIANLPACPEDFEKDIPPRVAAADTNGGDSARTRHRTPSADIKDSAKPAINVSINNNVGNLCYAPVFIGHGRSSSKEAKGDQVASHIKTGVNIVDPKHASISLFVKTNNSKQERLRQSNWNSRAKRGKGENI